MAEYAYDNYGVESLYDKYNLAMFDSEAQRKPIIKEAPQVKRNHKAIERAELYIDTRARVINKSREEKIFKIKVLSVALSLMFTFLGASTILLSQQANIDAMQTQISDSEADLSILKGETTRLKNELNSTVSFRNIEEYAEKKLGLVKAEAYQINYINLAKGDKIIVSGNKEVKK